jgi:8-oxo-dGTP pyrophosphatase MutT (NUDIX family)
MSRIPTRTEVSAGGVAFRRRADRFEVALISVGVPVRWQLPKGLIGRDETPEAAALREVREEAGVECELLEQIERIEYWYVATERGGARVRCHKFVHFYLLRYLRGDVREHDAEVNEARWFEITEAEEMLAFKGERQVLARAKELLAASDV